MVNINILTIILIILGAIGIGSFISYFLWRPRRRIIRLEEEDIAQRNAELQRENLELQQSCIALEEKKEYILHSIRDFNENLTVLRDQAEDAAQVFYDQSMALAQEKFAAAAEQERQNYLDTVGVYQKELATAMEEGAQSFSLAISERTRQLKELEKKFAELLVSTEAAIAAAKRAEEIKQQSNFYRMQLSELDLEEIRMLRNISPYLRDKEPLNKVIWKCYYEKPATDLIGRVIGLGVHTGIYKITNLENNMCYVGQAVNLADRWKQHIKRGLGAEAPTRNKLYPAMMAFGVENFSFEVVEECSRDALDAREDYWQDYFKAKEFGYSIK